MQTWCTEKAARWRPSWTHRRRGRRVSHGPAVERTTWHRRDCRVLNNNKHSVGIRLHPQSATAPWWVVLTHRRHGWQENNLASSSLSSSEHGNKQADCRHQTTPQYSAAQVSYPRADALFASPFHRLWLSRCDITQIQVGTATGTRRRRKQGVISWDGSTALIINRQKMLRNTVPNCLQSTIIRAQQWLKWRVARGAQPHLLSLATPPNAIFAKFGQTRDSQYKCNIRDSWSPKMHKNKLWGSALNPSVTAYSAHPDLQADREESSLPLPENFTPHSQHCESLGHQPLHEEPPPCTLLMHTTLTTCCWQTTRDKYKQTCSHSRLQASSEVSPYPGRSCYPWSSSVSWVVPSTLVHCPSSWSRRLDQVSCSIHTATSTLSDTAAAAADSHFLPMWR